MKEINKMKVSLSKPWITEEDIKAVEEVLMEKFSF